MECKRSAASHNNPDSLLEQPFDTFNGLEPRVGKDTRGSKKEGEDTEEFLIILRYHAC
jgi:hypothetical protein